MQRLQRESYLGRQVQHNGFVWNDFLVGLADGTVKVQSRNLVLFWRYRYFETIEQFTIFIVFFSKH